MDHQTRQRQIEEYKLSLTLDQRKLTIKVQEIATQQEYFRQIIAGYVPSHIWFEYRVIEHFFEAILQEELRIDWERMLMILTKQVPNKKKKKEIEVKLFRAENIPKEQGVLITKSPSLLDLGTSIKDYCFFDIETTGLRKHVGFRFKITSIILFDGKELRTYVNGINLDQFKEDIRQYKAVVTFNGRQFDLQETARELGIDWGGVIDFDLMTIYHQLGISGGLKNIKEQLGITHPLLKDLNGLSAPLLWAKHRKGDPHALRILQAYNAEDVIPMRYMVEYACQRLRRGEGTPSLECRINEETSQALIKKENQQVMNSFLERIQVDFREVEKFVEEQRQMPVKPQRVFYRKTYS